MTISSETRKAGPFNGNDVTTAFPFTFKCFTSADLSVVYTTALSVESTLVLDSDYTVSLNGDQNASPGGTVTYSLLATGEKLTIIGDVAYTQETDIQNLGGFYPEVFENALDKLTMAVQQVNERVGRAVLVDVSSSTDPAVLLDSITASEADSAASAAAALISEANSAALFDDFDDRYLGAKAVEPALDNDGDALQTGALYYNTVSNVLRIYNGTAWQATATATPASFTSNSFSGNGVTVNFTLSTTPASVASLFVFVSGVAQRPTTDYTFLGTTLTFTSAPPLGTDNVLAFVATTVSVGTPDDGTVTTAKLADQVFNGLTTVTAVSTDYVAIADTSDSGNKKKALISDIAALATITFASAAEYQTGTNTTKALNSAVAREKNIVLGTLITTTAGTSIDVTGLPTWAKRITLMFNGVSTTGTSIPMVQIGDSGGPENSGYVGVVVAMQSGTSQSSFSSGFSLETTGSAANTMYGSLTLTLIDSATNLWAISGVLGLGNAARGISISGTKALTATLDRIRLTTTGGVETFDGGSFNIAYE